MNSFKDIVAKGLISKYLENLARKYNAKDGYTYSLEVIDNADGTFTIVGEYGLSDVPVYEDVMEVVTTGNSEAIDNKIEGYSKYYPDSEGWTIEKRVLHEFEKEGIQTVVIIVGKKSLKNTL